MKKITWTKDMMNVDQASCGPKWGNLWMNLDLDTMKTGYVFISNNKVVTKQYKRKADAKKAAEKWLRS